MTTPSSLEQQAAEKVNQLQRALAAAREELAEVTNGYNALAQMFQEKRNENALQRQQLKAALEKLAAMKQQDYQRQLEFDLMKQRAEAAEQQKRKD